jgi:hypothetical protein
VEKIEMNFTDRKLTGKTASIIRVSVLAVAIFNAPFSTNVAYSQVGAVTGTVTAGFIIDKLSGRINELITHAENTGDFLLSQALRNTLQLLDSLKSMGDSFLNKTFDGLSDQQKQLFTNIDALLEDTNRTSQEILDKTTAITDEVYSMLNDIPVVGKGRYVVLRYSPSTIVWEENREVTLKITGLNVAPGKPILKLNGEDIKPSSVTQQVATFQIPADLVRQPFDDYAVVNAEIELRDDGWFWDTPYTYPIKLTYAPKIFGTVNALQMIAPSTTTERSGYLHNEREFKSRNEVVRITQTPILGGDWRIDPGSLRFQKTRGEASDPLYVEGPATATGFTMAMNCREYYESWHDKRAGWGFGWWEWQEVRPITANVTSGIPGERYSSLGKTVVWTLPINPTSLSGMFVDFRGNSLYFGDKSSQSPLVRIQRNDNKLVIEPRFQQVSEPRKSGKPYEVTTREMFEEVRRQQFRYLDKFVIEFEKALATAESGAGEAIFADLSPLGGLGGASNFDHLKQKLGVTKSLIAEMNSPLTPPDAKEGLLFRISSILGDVDFASRVKAVFGWSES